MRKVLAFLVAFALAHRAWGQGIPTGMDYSDPVIAFTYGTNSGGSVDPAFWNYGITASEGMAPVQYVLVSGTPKAMPASSQVTARASVEGVAFMPWADFNSAMGTWDSWGVVRVEVESLSNGWKKITASGYLAFVGYIHGESGYLLASASLASSMMEPNAKRFMFVELRGDWFSSSVGAGGEGSEGEGGGEAPPGWVPDNVDELDDTATSTLSNYGGWNNLSTLVPSSQVGWLTEYTFTIPGQGPVDFSWSSMPANNNDGGVPGMAAMWGGVDVLRLLVRLLLAVIVVVCFILRIYRDLMGTK